MKILITEKQAEYIFKKKYQCPKCHHSWKIEKKDNNYELCHWCGWDDSKSMYNEKKLFEFWKEESMKDYQNLKKEKIDEKWSEKYKKSINCKNPKGFSQKAHCLSKRKKINRELTLENILPSNIILNEIKLLLNESDPPLYKTIKELVEIIVKKEIDNLTQEETEFITKYLEKIETDDVSKNFKNFTPNEKLNFFKTQIKNMSSDVLNSLFYAQDKIFLKEIDKIKPKITTDLINKKTKEFPGLQDLSDYIDRTLKKSDDDYTYHNKLLSLSNLLNNCKECKGDGWDDIKKMLQTDIDDLEYKFEKDAEILNPKPEETIVKPKIDEPDVKLDDSNPKVDEPDLKPKEELDLKPDDPNPKVDEPEIKFEESETVVRPFDGKNSHMEKFNKISTKNKKLADAIRTIVLSLGKTKSMTLELTFEGSKVLGKDGNLLPEIINIIEAQSPGFLKKLENGEYKFLENAEGNWNSLNKLDTNTVDRTELLKLYANKKGKDLNNLTEKQFNEFIDDFIKDCNDNPQTIKTLIEENSGNLTKNIEKLSEEGLQIEQFMYKKIDITLKNEFEIVWTPKGEGNPVDTIVGADMIVKRKTDNTYHLVQIKKSRWNLYVTNSKLTNGEIIIGYTSSPVRLKNGYVGLVDKSNKWIFFPPQEIGNVTTNESGKKVFKPTGLGFNKNMQIIDIDPTRTSDTFYTNINIKNKKIEIDNLDP